MRDIAPDHRIITFSTTAEEKAALDQIVAQTPSYMGRGDLIRSAVRAYLRVVAARLRTDATPLDP